jgi:peptide/nickel transport system ATP-binding protein/oligopeptide transport system ATP-binding protein
MNLFEIKNLYKTFEKAKRKRTVYAVRDVTLAIERGEILGVIGESGCGKTTLGKLLLRLEHATQGSIVFDGKEITGYSFNQMRPIRSGMQMIFQGSTASFNPYYTVRQIINEPLNNYRKDSKEKKEEAAVEMLYKVGLDETYMDRYPNEMSGGQRQRVGIARALVLNPEFVVCDEALSSVDYIIKNKIMSLLLDLKKSLSLTYLFISHDISTVKNICSRVVIMYLGNIVEIMPDIGKGAAHPYTKALMAAALSADPEKRETTNVLFKDDEVTDIPECGCVFQYRCLYSRPDCLRREPKLARLDDGHFAACHLCE